jgi:transcriptional regulator
MAGTAGKLVGHVARNNPLWRCAPEQELLLVFQGPSAYISPNWYATKQEAGKVVPTWNYAVVHVHATLKALESPHDVLAIVSKLTDLHEASQPHPWKVADAPTDYTERLLANIVGVAFLITRVQGKWKVSQNQPAVNQQGVAKGLIGLGNDAALQMASLVNPAE